MRPCGHDCTKFWVIEYSYLLNIRGDPVYLFENNFPPSTSPFIYLERIFHPRHYGRLLILVNFPPSPPRFKRICPPSPFIRASPCTRNITRKGNLLPSSRVNKIGWQFLGANFTDFSQIWDEICRTK